MPINKWKIQIVAILAVTSITLACIATGNDGIIITLGIGSICTLAGYAIPRK